MTIARATILVPMLGLAVALCAAPTAPAYGQPSGTGTIEGVVTMPEHAARRTLNRYAGSGDAAARALQAVPKVAYLAGPVGGGAAPARASAAGAQIAQRDTAFAPGAVIVPVDATVAFPNRDGFYHNVFSFSPTKRFDLGRYPRGESKSVVFDQAGVVKVYCEVHQFMRAAVIVVENPYHTEVGEDGRFAIRDVPAGTHRLIVWDIERKPQELSVTVSAGSVTRVQVAFR